MVEVAEVEGWHANFDRWPVGLALVDCDGSLLSANQALSRMLAASSDDALIGANARALLRALGGGEDAAELERLYRSEGAGSWEGRLVSAEGHELWARIDVRPVDTATAKPRRILHVTDMGERRLAEQALEAAHVCWRIGSQSATADTAIAALLPALARVFELELAAAWMFDPESSTLGCQSVWQSPSAEMDAFASATREASLVCGVGLPGRAWESGAAQWSAAIDEDADSARVEAAQADGVGVGIALPLRAGDRVLAVLELAGRRPRRLDDAFLDSLTAVGADTGEAIARKGVGAVLEDARELLLVEDDRFVAKVVAQMLGEIAQHREVVHVERLSEARERLTTARPACVLLDLTLPDADGLEALLEVRKLAPEVPIVVLTGQDDEELAVRALQEGAQDYLSKRQVGMEALTRAVRYAIERKGAEQQGLERLLRDRLTGFPGRVLFTDRLRVALRHQPPGAVAVVLINLDRFRLVNDSLGHEAGDALLLELADRLVATAGPEATVGCFGGDDFAVLVDAPKSELSPVELAVAVAEAFAAPARVAGESIGMRATIGIATNGDESDPSTLISQADTALSRGKDLGGDRWELFDAAVRKRLREQLQIETSLRAAIEADGQLQAHYQPVVSLDDRRIVGFEALVRWQHPERGLLSPAAFIDVAEQTGLVVPLGRLVLAQACEHLAEWRRSTPAARGVHVNVNLSARQLADAQLLDDVARIVADAGVEPEDVCLEVTETALMQDADLATSMLNELKSAGFQIAVDDFGTGYSSLSYLRRFPVDMLKLDCSFVSAFRAGGDSAIVTAVARMAEAMDILVLAEGVEAEDEIEPLRQLGYEFAQGYLFGRPEPADSVRSRLVASESRVA